MGLRSNWDCHIWSRVCVEGFELILGGPHYIEEKFLCLFFSS